MGNFLSIHQQRDDGRLHICDQCGFWTTNKAALRLHRAHMCRWQPDGRYVHLGRAVTLSNTPTAHQQHDHQHDEGCSGCFDEHTEQRDDEQLRNDVDEELQRYMQETGGALPPEAAAALSDFLVGIIGNGECANMLLSRLHTSSCIIQ